MYHFKKYIEHRQWTGRLKVLLWTCVSWSTQFFMFGGKNLNDTIIFPFSRSENSVKHVYNTAIKYEFNK